MVGTCKKEDIGKEKTCPLCGSIFIAGRPIDKKTFIYCVNCSFSIRSKNNKLLSPEQKKINYKYNKRHNSEYTIRNGGNYQARTKKWRQRHTDRRNIAKSKTQLRHNEETIQFAINRCNPWTYDEIQFLKENSANKTARELAISLGRTYLSIIMKAFHEKIKLMTPEKRHGILITK